MTTSCYTFILYCEHISSPRLLALDTRTGFTCSAYFFSFKGPQDDFMYPVFFRPLQITYTWPRSGCLSWPPISEPKAWFFRLLLIVFLFYFNRCEWSFFCMICFVFSTSSIEKHPKNARLDCALSQRYISPCSIFDHSPFTILGGPPSEVVDWGDCESVEFSKASKKRNSSKV